MEGRVFLAAIMGWPCGDGDWRGAGGGGCDLALMNGCMVTTMRSNIFIWLWCMWKAWRCYRAKGTMFSARLRFLDELRPKVSASSNERIAYPDAIFWVKPKDLARAKAAMHKSRKHQ